MKAIGIVVIGFFIGYATYTYAEGPSVTGGCSIEWDAPAGVVDGYRVYAGATAENKQMRRETAETSIPCNALRLPDGQNYIHVTAFNAAGEGGASNTIPFVLVSTVPQVPSNLRLQQ